jgi:hypothetical protein
MEKMTKEQENALFGPEDHEAPITGWAVIVQYDCRLGERGTVVSQHKSYELARKAARRTGYDSFLRVAADEGRE